ncbi:hypothetical protein [Calothrix sp. NIES-3974]|uniref:hypothetical protein n=1 Tax=Calothrix sp. NIES-3974 TaxID=2005462 RepID=UPI000B5E76A0|nr:hypothetical protein [Calothrix sp. NIES-3974]BAZ05694.1 hypothetical protein NIES3974_23470 [Calothrix sp. NIES-3974]
MDSLQEQVLTLGHKLDVLSRLIEQLDQKVSSILSECQVESIAECGNSHRQEDTPNYHFKGHISFNSEMEHKDILADGVYSDTNLQGGDRSLTPEVQIQRLTAQLTAAYNRIAALEEQLLIKRISS